MGKWSIIVMSMALTLSLAACNQTKPDSPNFNTSLIQTAEDTGGTKACTIPIPNEVASKEWLFALYDTFVNNKTINSQPIDMSVLHDTIRTINVYTDESDHIFVEFIVSCNIEQVMPWHMR